MIKMIVLTLAFCMSAVGVYAQKADFSGKWTLDVAKSKLGERNNIETQTLTVAQTANDIKIDTATKRTPPPSGTPGGGGGGGGGGMMGRGGDGAATYMLDGKDMKSEIAGPGGAMVPVTTNGKIDGGKLLLSNSRTFTTPNGAITSTTKETWELSADGKTLTVNVERTSPRGTDTTTKVFVKG
jgi:hypothetical protein